MNEWIRTIIFTSLIAVLVKEMIPKGEKSPFYPPMKFLLSLLCILSIFSPLFHFFSGQISWKLPDTMESLQGEDPQTQDVFLQKSVQEMANAVKLNFSDTDFSLAVYTDPSGALSAIGVQCQDPEKGTAIASFLSATYTISAEYQKGESKS